ncbi:MAG: glycosyltransferase, partial [Mycoplasmatota bacterium]
PLVHTYHTMYEDYTHYITKGYFEKSSKKVLEYLTKFYCDKTASQLIVPTKKTRDLFVEKYKIQNNVFIVPTGIEVEKFHQERYKKQDIIKLKEKMSIKEDDFVILFVGRIAKEKNIDFLINCQKDLIKNNKNIKLVLVGDGPQLEDIKKYINKNNLEDNIIILGKLPWEEVCKIYCVADVFATASKTETQGLTVIEAMAASKPVLAIDDDAFKNVVISDVNGYLFRSKRQYKKLVNYLFKNNDKLIELSKQARITSESHSSKHFADQILNVYNFALGNRKLKKEKKIKKIIRRFREKRINGKTISS